MSENEHDRRRFDIDHDLLTKIHAIVENMNGNFNEHMKQDKTDFNTVHQRINVLSKYVYIGIGGVVVLEFVLMFLKK